MSSSLMRGRDLVGLPVVDVSKGEDVAEVRDIVFNPGDGRLTGFTLNERGRWAGRLQAVLPIDRVSGVGSGAVMIADADDLVDPARGPNDVSAVAEANEEVTDDLAVTESGHTLGTVRDVVIEGGKTPRVVAVEIAGGEAGDGFLPLSPQGGLSASALVVPDDYAERVCSDLIDLSDQIDELNQRTP